MAANSQWTTQQPQTQYLGYARAYQNNPIVFACIEMLATSVAEPTIVGRKWQRNSPRPSTATAGPAWRDGNRAMIRNGAYRDVTTHPLLKLLENPNPMTTSDTMWGDVILDRAIAGNAYLYKSRGTKGPFKGVTQELWRLRPDRVKIIPKIGGVEAYEYNTGTDKVRYPAEDVLHFKTRNPMNDYYGQPTLLAIASRIDIDDYMNIFLRTFFESGGASGPGSILTVRQKLPQEAKEEISQRFRTRYGRPGELMILDNAESTYQQMGLNRGLRDALPKEIDAQTEARIAAVFGIPGSILGLLIGYESSSYANKRSDWQVYWDITMAPLLAGLSAEISRKLVPEYGGIDEVVFDLGEIRALQEDVDLLHKRHRDNLQFGLESWQEAREAIGLNPNPTEGIFFVPSNMVPTEVDILGEPPEVAAPPKQIAAPEPMDVIDELRHTCGKLLGKDIQGNPLLWCSRCKIDVRARDIVDKPHVIIKTVERDMDGKIARVLEVVS